MSAKGRVFASRAKDLSIACLAQTEQIEARTKHQTFGDLKSLRVSLSLSSMKESAKLKKILCQVL